MNNGDYIRYNQFLEDKANRLWARTLCDLDPQTAEKIFRERFGNAPIDGLYYLVGVTYDDVLARQEVGRHPGRNVERFSL